MVRTETVDIIEQAGGAVVPADEKSVVEWGSINWESDGCEDIQPMFPIIKLIQRTSRQDGASKHVGEFWHSDREEGDAYTADLNIIGLVKRDTRAMFIEGQDQPVCMSADGKAPLPNMPAWDGTMTEFKFRDGVARNPLQFAPGSCSVCPFSDWSPSGEPPHCRESKVVLVKRLDDDSLAQLRISGMSIKPFEQMVAKFLRPKNLPLYSKELVVTTATREKPQKIWEEMEFHPMPLDIDQALVYAGVLREFRARFEASLEDESVTTWQDDGMGAMPEDDNAPFE